MKDKRHEKYLSFTQQTKLHRQLVDKFMDAETTAANLKKKKMRARKNPGSELALDRLLQTK